MNIKQSYLLMFEILDEYYFKTYNDTLGMLLGAMNPELFLDSNSADPAKWEDWKDCVKKVVKSENLSMNEAYQAIILYLQFHIDEYDFDLKWVVKELTEEKFSIKWCKHINNFINKEK